MGRSGVKCLAVAVVVELGVALGVVACGDPPPKEVKTSGVEAPAPSPSGPSTSPARSAPIAPPLDPVVGDVVPAGDEGGSVTVRAVEADVNAGRLFASPKGKQYYAAQVEGCAGPAERGLSFDDSYFLLEMADKTVFDHGLPVKKPDLLGGELPAGGCLDGWVTFVVPDDAEPANVVYDGSNRIKWRIPPEEAKASR